MDAAAILEPVTDHHAERTLALAGARTLRALAEDGGLETMTAAERAAALIGACTALNRFIGLNAGLHDIVARQRIALAVVVDGIAAKPNCPPWPDDLLRKNLATVRLIAGQALPGGLDHMAPAARGALVAELCALTERLLTDHAALAVQVEKLDELMVRCAAAESELAALKPPVAPAAKARPQLTVVAGGAPPDATD